ncbi:MAG: AAA family ATPase [Lachnospiraceae bacterium]|uniref:AAA family ATPase n=1 Tax=Galactobacillus timonensis TaxID=2041840 RepID=UPI0023F25AA3|nr:AAA family ATPase [Galactobacillus timonensis]MCI6754076.1 AAA family ATPase [Galactobacillus timonensis]MDD7087032.1 AAA family ATPase [Galactobacillus timonensis]MDY5222121.1 AAA family ATPase [Lachnospiraceae bacterium]
MSDLDDEKQRLYREVMGKRRTLSGSDTTVTSLDDGSAKKDGGEMSSSVTNGMLRSADNAFHELKKILNSQQKDLEQMSRENGLSSQDMERMQEEIREDYGLSEKDTEEKPQTEEINDAEAFQQIEKEMNERIIGQKDAVHSLCAAFRRPYVMGTGKGQAKNVILVTGPNGSGRHVSVKTMAQRMKAHQLLSSDEVYTLDLSQYSSAAQEGIFLQDLYQALSGEGRIITFENFESGFAPFLRMINDLVCKGTMTLSKRYVLNKGVLVENQTGLVKDAVDHFSAEGFYLVFLTSKGTSAVQDAFGADFLYHVLDTVKLDAFDASSAAAYVSAQRQNFMERVQGQLKLDIRLDDAVSDWIVKNYDKSAGADAINSLFNDFYVVLSEYVLHNDVDLSKPVPVGLVDDKPCAQFGDQKVSLLRSRTSQEEIDAVNAELDEIVGLKPIKDYIHSLQSHIALNQLRRAQGLKAAEVSRHMIFTGNPGTGKTTIARLLARYMKAIGALSQGQLVEVTRADLVAQYVGQTAPLTMSVIKSALGGVLFIDEAYSLYRGSNDSFGLEAIDTIVKAMEDYRGDLIVILAGYKREMKEFLDANSGLKSRFPNQIDFPDYTGEELLQIADLQAKGKGYVIADDARKPLLDYFTEVQSTRAEEAGNGRFARNTIEEAILHQAERVMKDPGQKLDELRLSDFDLKMDEAEEKEDA